MDTILPSAKPAKREAEKAEIEARKRAEDERMKIACAAVFQRSGADGLIVLQWLRRQCGHNEAILALDPASMEVNPLATTYQAMRLNLYLQLRKFIPTEILKEVELCSDPQ